ncbi:MAG: PadR family transcriptional regulator [Anaerolineaceae bacterium]|nr:PadR family transcriptional regulator [Anaerolineaceae bacterium]
MHKLNPTRFVILGMLDHEALSGYDLKKRIDLTISRFWNLGYGQIYPTLHELEAEGKIECIQQIREKGPERSIFQTTESGKKELTQWLLTQTDHEYTRYEILLKLYFSAEIDPSFSIQRVKNFRDKHLPELELLRRFHEELEPLAEQDPRHLEIFLTVLFGEYIHEAYLQWAAHADKLLKMKEKNK